MTVKELRRGLGQIAFASPLFLFAPLYRRWHLRWGATDAELSAPMPGDDIVVRPSFSTTRAITIDAPPAAVWPWLVQLGYGRAGFYSYDLFDNAGHASAEQLLPEYQHPQPGDWIPMAASVNDTTAFRIREIAPYSSMLWVKPHSTWAWTLRPLDGNRTRLMTRLRDEYPWRTAPILTLLSIVLFEFGDFPMMRKQLLGVKRRAERYLADPTAAGQGQPA